MTRSPLALLLALVCGHVVLRAPLLGRLGFVNPDSAIFLRYDFLVFSNRLPLYPILVRLAAWPIGDPVLAGQIVSAVGCGVAAALLALIARELVGGPRAPQSGTAALFAAIFYTASPFAWVNGASVLAEGPFTALTCGCVLAFLQYRRTGGHMDLFATLLLAGLAPLMRAEGWLLALPALLAIVRGLRLPTRPGDRLLAWTGLLGYGLVFWWYFAVVDRGGYIMELGLGAGELTPTKFWAFLFRYLIFLPLLASPLVAVTALIPGTGALRKPRSVPGNRFGEALILVIVGLWLAGLSVHWAWDARFLIAPAALVAALGGAGTARLWSGGRRRTTVAVVAVTMVLGVVFFRPVSRPLLHMGSELREVSMCMEAASVGRDVWSTEIASTGYYLDRLPLVLDVDRIRPGDVLVVHDMFGGQSVDLRDLEQRFELDSLCRAGRRVSSPPPSSGRAIFQPRSRPAPDDPSAPEQNGSWIESRAYLVTGYR